MNKYRKTQQQLEEAERRADRAEKNITLNVRHSSTSVGPRGQRAVSVSRETTRIVRVWAMHHAVLYVSELTSATWVPKYNIATSDSLAFY